MYRNILNKIILILIDVILPESNANYLSRSLLLISLNPLVHVKLGEPRCRPNSR